MELSTPVKPDTEEPDLKIPASAVFTLMLHKGHQAVYYTGFAEDAAANQTAVKLNLQQPQALRKALEQYKQEVKAKQEAGIIPKGFKLYVFIKPADESTYEDMIAALDEMTINNITTYSIGELTDTEKQLLARD